MKKITAADITSACVKHLVFSNPRTHYVLPNAYWGLGFRYEIDLLSISEAGFATEIEIKVSLGDLKADKLKNHNHDSKMIKRLYFAMPDELVERGTPHVPEHAGIIAVRDCGVLGLKPVIIRKAKEKREAVRFSRQQIFKALQLCQMRYWDQYHNFNNWLNESPLDLSRNISQPELSLEQKGN